MEKINELSFKLHDMLLNSKEYLELKNIEKKLLEDEISSSLLKNYHKLQEEYMSNKSEEMLKKLHKAKLMLDENEIVVSYKKVYKNYQILIGNITDIVFEDFSKQSIIDKIIRAK